MEDGSTVILELLADRSDMVGGKVNLSVLRLRSKCLVRPVLLAALTSADRHHGGAAAVRHGSVSARSASPPMKSTRFLSDPMKKPIDIDEPSTWPSHIYQAVSEWAETCAGTTCYTNNLRLDLELAAPFQQQFAGYFLRAYHYTRLLPHERSMVMTQGLRMLAELTETRASLTAEQDEWHSEWLETLPLLHLGPNTSIIEAGAALELWQKVPAALTQFEDRSKRVRGMKRDMRIFEDSTNAMLLQLEMSDPGVGGPGATVKMLSNKLTQAQQIETKASVARGRLEDATGKVAAADRIARAAASNLEALAAGLPNTGSLPEQIGNLEAREKVHERMRQRRETLVPLSRGETETALRDTLTSFDEDGALAEIEELKRQDAQYNDSENKSYAELSDKERELATLEAGVGEEVAQQMRKNAEAELTQNARAWATKRLGQILLAHAIEQHRSQQEQPLMRRASQLFSMLTAHSFTSIEQEFDDKDTLRLVGRRDTDHTVGLPAMSEGTRDQLYLALRLAYLEEYADRTEPIPFIGDDLVTIFDDERTTLGLKALAATGGHIQPILFTHHKRIVELAQAELGNIVDIVVLA
jgi:chromosome segregation protein